MYINFVPAQFANQSPYLYCHTMHGPLYMYQTNSKIPEKRTPLQLRHYTQHVLGVKVFKHALLRLYRQVT